MNEIDTSIRRSLEAFAHFVWTENWYGREREAVSLYAFGFLSKEFGHHGILKDPTQIGLDVAVRQLEGPRRKKLVCKDLVIWPTAAGNCWDEQKRATLYPLAILEWKTRTSKSSQYDLDWLARFSGHSPEFVGYAVSLCHGLRRELNVVRVQDGRLQSNWLQVVDKGAS